MDWDRLAKDIGDLTFLVEGMLCIDGQRHYIELGDASFHCREVLVHELRCEFQALEAEAFNIYDEQARVHRPTTLIAPIQSCRRSDCMEALLFTLDSLVALPSLLLNPDRYLGNWWKSTPEDLFEKGGFVYNYLTGGEDDTFLYYGVDNTIFFHPALLTTVIGLFRQALQIHRFGHDEGISNIVSRKELDDIISNDKVEDALSVVNELRPWLESSNRNAAFAIRNKDWNNFLYLHKALFTHGFEGVFGPMEEGWALNNVYLPYTGAHTYFNTNRKNKLRKLARTV